MRWIFKSPVGKFCIERHPDGYWLTLNGELLDVCDSAVACADNVYTFETGCYEWDVLAANFKVQQAVPQGLSEWESE